MYIVLGFLKKKALKYALFSENLKNYSEVNRTCSVFRNSPHTRSRVPVC